MILVVMLTETYDEVVTGFVNENSELIAASGYYNLLDSVHVYHLSHKSRQCVKNSCVYF